MSPAETNARAYCRSINADPDEMVRHNVFGMVPRWRCYGGAIVERPQLTTVPPSE